MELKRSTEIEEIRAEIAELLINLEKLFRDRSDYQRQREKAEWMKGRDKNTSYFHARTIIRQQVNKIKGLQEASGIWTRNQQGIERLVDDYFRGLFWTSLPSEGDLEAVFHISAPRLTMEDSQILSQPLTDHEVKDALSSMSLSKSPGPDGYPALF